jgi:hypothetical protein
MSTRPATSTSKGAPADVNVDDNAGAVELWRAIQATARGGGDDELGRLLGQLALTPDQGEQPLRQWLTDIAARADAPAQLATIVSGGHVDRLVNIARADTINLAVHLGIAAPVDAGSAGRGRHVRFNIPPRLVGFTGRDAELGALQRALGVTDEVVITQAVAGLGGVGKSQLAARYVHTHADAYDVVAWIRAEDDATLDLSALAAQLGEPVLGLTPAERADLARIGLTTPASAGCWS